MVETYQPKPLKERKSQNVGLWDAAKWFAPILLFGKIGAVAGWALGKFAMENRNPETFANRKVLSILGGYLGAFFTIFLKWRKVEAARLGVQDLYDDYKKAINLRCDNACLEKDNEVVRSMIEFEHEKQALSGAATSVQHMQHEGVVHHAPEITRHSS